MPEELITDPAYAFLNEDPAEIDQPEESPRHLEPEPAPAEEVKATPPPRQELNLDFDAINRRLQEQEERYAAIRREVEESKQATEFWRQQAERRPTPPPEAKPKLTPEEFMDLLAADGVDALRGVAVSPEDFEAAMERRLEEKLAKFKIQSEQERVYADFPELRKDDSELSQRVVKIIKTDYHGLIQTEEALVLATRRAAERAKAEQEAERGTNNQRKTASGAYRSGSGSPGASNARAIVLSDDQRYTARQMGLTEQEMLEAVRASQGGR